jgi:hypothetical protein
MYLTRNQAMGRPIRGFESLPLRQNKKPRQGLFCFGGESTHACEEGFERRRLASRAGVAERDRIPLYLIPRSGIKISLSAKTKKPRDGAFLF